MRVIDADHVERGRHVAKSSPQRDVLGIVDPEARGTGLDVAHRDGFSNDTPAADEKTAALERMIAARVIDHRTTHVDGKNEGIARHV